MIGETVAQVKGSKPRFKPAGKTSEITRQRVSELSEAYLEVRNAKLRSQAFLVEAQAREKAGDRDDARIARQGQGEDLTLLAHQISVYDYSGFIEHGPP